MRDSFSVLFQLKIYMIWTKEPIKVQNFRLSNAHLKLHQICTLIGRSLQVYKIPAKGTEEFCLIILKSYAKFEEKLISCFKNDKNLAILTRALESLKTLDFD